MHENRTVIDLEKTGMILRRYADTYGYNVKDIQRYLGLSCPQPIYRWFKGIILPSVDNLLRLSELFDVHMEDLLVKRKVPMLSDFRLDMKTDSILLLKRMNAYHFLIGSIKSSLCTIIDCMYIAFGVQFVEKYF